MQQKQSSLLQMDAEALNEVISKFMKSDDYFDKKTNTWHYKRNRQVIAIKKEGESNWRFMTIDKFALMHFKVVDVIPAEIIPKIN